MFINSYCQMKADAVSYLFLKYPIHLKHILVVAQKSQNIRFNNVSCETFSSLIKAGRNFCRLYLMISERKRMMYCSGNQSAVMIGRFGTFWDAYHIFYEIIIFCLHFYGRDSGFTHGFDSIFNRIFKNAYIFDNCFLIMRMPAVSFGFMKKIVNIFFRLGDVHIVFNDFTEYNTSFGFIRYFKYGFGMTFGEMGFQYNVSFIASKVKYTKFIGNSRSFFAGQAAAPVKLNDLDFLEKQLMRFSKEIFPEKPEHIRIMACRNVRMECRAALLEIKRLAREEGKGWQLLTWGY